jgi:hypothetical protein
MAHIIPFERTEIRVVRRGLMRFLSLTTRLRLLRHNTACASRSVTRERYLAQADEHRFQAESFRDPKTQAQTLRLAAIWESWAMQTTEYQNSGENNGDC